MRNIIRKRDWENSFGSLSGEFSAIVFFIGIAVLAGWAFDISALKSVFPNIVSMKANTALCFVLLGAGLWSLQEERRASILWRVVATVFALGVFLIGSATLCEYVFGWDLKIDQILFEELPGTIMTYSPGRMALNTSVCFILLGIAILLACLKSLRARVVSQTFFLVSSYIAFLALLGYFYGVTTFTYGIAKYTAMAIHTTVAFLLISLSGIFNQPQIGVMKVISDGGQAGAVVRRFLVMTVLLSILADVFAFLGVRLNWYDATFATTLHAAVFLLAMSVAVILSGFSIMRSMEKEREYKIEIGESEQRYKVLYNLSPDAIMILEPGKCFAAGNPATMKMFKCRDEAEFRTKTPADLSPEYQPDGELSSRKSQRMMVAAMDEGAHFFEWKHKRLDGNEFWATVLLSKTELDGRVMLQATVRDIDAQKTQEIELANKIWELEKFYKVTMDREKRIIELKKEVNDLKTKLGGQ